MNNLVVLGILPNALAPALCMPLAPQSSASRSRKFSPCVRVRLAGRFLCRPKLGHHLSSMVEVSPRFSSSSP